MSYRGQLPNRGATGIVFEHVWFRYAGAADWTLQDFSAHLPVGSIVALVGENGAGKTTLVKLLCGFYQPTQGRILLDGVELTSLDPTVLRAALAAVFQDFARLELTVQRAIGVGELDHLDDEPAVRRALTRAGDVDLPNELPDGIRSQLGARWRGGMELSTGQWQKIALARALMRTQPRLLFFDEPTASLDAQTEHQLFERYTAAARMHASLITVLVSHRFSTVATADLIFVLERGKLVEAGTHDELLARGGQYAELYVIQADSYR
jgi:ATP-binding cassette subfamily B protein